MINLLPGDVKEQVNYSKRNQALVSYVWLTAMTIIICGGLLGYAYLSVRNQTASARALLATQQTEVSKYKSLEKDAKSVNARVSAIKAIQANQSHFSLLLEDLAKVTPTNVVISSISLTGDDKKPVRIAGTTTSLSAIASFRDALEQKSPRVSGADIENIGRDEKGNYNFGITIGFRPGQAR